MEGVWDHSLQFKCLRPRRIQKHNTFHDMSTNCCVMIGGSSAIHMRRCCMASFCFGGRIGQNLKHIHIVHAWNASLSRTEVFRTCCMGRDCCSCTRGAYALFRLCLHMLKLLRGQFAWMPICCCNEQSQTNTKDNTQRVFNPATSASPRSLIQTWSFEKKTLQPQPSCLYFVSRLPLRLSVFVAVYLWHFQCLWGNKL